MRVFGVDFSGARDAGRRIWIATGVVDGESLRIVDCRRGEDLDSSGRTPEECLPAVRALIQAHPDGVFGCDFPFGLPRELVEEETWEEFVDGFARRYSTAQEFRDVCRAAARGRDLRRWTDRDAKAPFCAYNLRLYRQTFHGIRDVLAPLVRDRVISVAPMQDRRAGAALILEICPASTLKRLGLYRPYKGGTLECREQRRVILQRVAQSGLATVDERLIPVIVDDAGGDALDGVIATVGASGAMAGSLNPDASTPLDWRIEGYIYFKYAGLNDGRERWRPIATTSSG